jgi:hypothetical protein
MKPWTLTLDAGTITREKLVDGQAKGTELSLSVGLHHACGDPSSSNRKESRTGLAWHGRGYCCSGELQVASEQISIYV